LGELFDHGIDSMAVWLINLSIFSIFGQGPESLTIWQYYWIVLVMIAGFYMAHWEKYITGVLFLPWAYDVGQLVSGIKDFPSVIFYMKIANLIIFNHL
jgi:ethanolaminephosphotransferase